MRQDSQCIPVHPPNLSTRCFMAEEPQTYNGVRKLNRAPSAFKIYFGDYRYNKDDPEYKGKDPDGLQPDPEMGVDAFIHPLTRDEKFDVEAVWNENFRGFLKRGAEKDDAMWKGSRVSNIQQVFYCIRKGPESNAPRLMTEDEASELNILEVDRIIDEYNRLFVPTREERKNSLRARFGKDSGKPSSSPNTSEAQS